MILHVSRLNANNANLKYGYQYGGDGATGAFLDAIRRSLALRDRLWRNQTGDSGSDVIPHRGDKQGECDLKGKGFTTEKIGL